MATNTSPAKIPVWQIGVGIAVGALTLFAFGYAISKGWKLGQK